MTIETPLAITPFADDNGLCQTLRISRTTAWRFRQAGMPFMRVGRGIRYDIAEVLDWIAKNGERIAPDSTAKIVEAK